MSIQPPSSLPFDVSNLGIHFSKIQSDFSYVVSRGGDVSVTDFTSVQTNPNDWAPVFQAAHDYAESLPSGGYVVAPPNHYEMIGSLTWDPNRVGFRGNGSLLDWANSAPASRGHNILSQVNSIFYPNTGNWIFYNCSAAVGGIGATLTNTVNGVQGTASLAMATIPGLTYNVTYTMQTGSSPSSDGVPQINVYAQNAIGSETIAYSASTATFWFRFIASQSTTYLYLKIGTAGLGDYASIGNINVAATDPVGVHVMDRSGSLYPSSDQFGQNAYSWGECILKGPGRYLSYAVDGVTPLQIYSGATSVGQASFGMWFDSPDVEGNRAGTSSRGLFHNISIENFSAGIAFDNQAYLTFLDAVSVNNCNFGMLTAQGPINAGENIGIYNSVMTGCDVNYCEDGSSVGFISCSIDLPKQVSIRKTGGNAFTYFEKCHIEQTSPGLSTQLATPIAISTTSGGFVFTDCEFQVDGGGPTPKFYSFLSTTNEFQMIAFNNCFQDNIQTTYFKSGPGTIVNGSAWRFNEFPACPLYFSDQGPAGSNECFKFGDFETPAGATKPSNGLIFLATNLEDQSGNFQSYTGQYATGNLSVALTTAQAYTGSQSLAISKLHNSGPLGSVYFFAPVRPGRQVWWTFFMNILPSLNIGGAPVNYTVEVIQDFTQLAGIETIYVSSLSSGSTNLSAGYRPHLSGLSGNLGQLFTSNQQGGLTISPAAGTGGWQQFNTDVFNHGYQKAPDWATHALLQLNFANFDGVLWGSGTQPTAFLDALCCWEM